MGHSGFGTFAAGLVCTLLLQLPPSASAQTEALTNESVVQFVAQKVSTSSILTRVRSARNSFEVSAESLVRLHQSRVPADVISAMLKASELPRDTLANQDVITMVAAGLPRALIVEKIQSANTAFDLTAAGLQQLNQSKVPASVISAMRRSTAAATSTGVTVPPSEVTPVTVPPSVLSPATMAAGSVPASTVVPAIVPVRGGATESGASTPSTVGTVSVAPATAEPAMVANAVGSGPGATITTPAPRVVADGETALFRVRTSVAVALTKVQDHLRSKLISYTTGPDQRVVSDWYNERGCGRGVQQCANRTIVGVTVEGSDAVITVQVFERTRQGGIDPTSWKVNLESRGRETAELAAALEAAIAR